MRLKISLKAVKNNYLIPFNYNHILSAIIYRKIADLDLASELHSSFDFKYFTFSQIHVPYRRLIPGKGVVSRDGKLNFYISSPHDYLIQSMVEGYLEDSQVNFMGQELLVEQVELLKQPEFYTKMGMKTMSPVVARVKREDKVWDLNPGDLRFYTALQQNLIRKYNSFYGDYDGDEYVKIVPDLESVKRKRITVSKNRTETHHRAYLMHFEMEADPRLVKFAYDCGLGEKNSMGFGMIETVGKWGNGD
ncbi:MAG: CRISPR-associated endoribonuclease Cas6 [Methanobacteriales archaeon Met13]